MAQNQAMPIQVRIGVTRTCNLRCVHCLADAASPRADEELTTPEWLALFDQLRAAKVFSLTLTGGEPFIRDDILTLLSHLAGPRRCSVSVITNGTLITREVATALRSVGRTHVTVSLDGMRDTNDAIRGLGSFDRAVSGVREMTSAGLRPAIAFTATRHNYRDLGALVDLASDIGAASVRVNELTPQGRCRPLYSDWSLRYPDDVEACFAIVDAARRRHPSLDVKCTLHNFLVYGQRRVPVDAASESHLADGCGACVNSCYVAPDGQVAPCEALSELVAGSVRETPFADIWRHGPALQRFRALRRVRVCDCDGCRVCAFNRVCNGGCRGLAYLAYADLRAPDPSCPYSLRAPVSQGLSTSGFP